MKKIIAATLLTLLLMGAGYGMGQFSLTFSGNILGPADKDFKDIYGNTVFFPEMQVSLKVFNGVCVWAGYGLLSATGTTPILEEEAKSTQNILSFGAGYLGDFSKKWSYKILAGAAYFTYKEEALGLVVEDNAFGFRVDLGLLHNFTNTFFAELSLGYMAASDTVMGQDIKLGGTKAGFGIGIRF